MLKISLKEPHENQRAILQDKTRFRVVACGRRFGKTELAKIATVIRFLKGERVWYCSPTNFNNKKVWRDMVALFRSVPPHLYKINNVDMRMELVNGDGFIEFVSLHEPDNLRGSGLDFVVVDEAAFVMEGVWEKVLQPMLLDTKGEALFISSTYGKNWFWRIYNYGLDPEQKNWKSFRFTSYDNPLLDPEDINEIRKNTSVKVFEQEYLASFDDDSGAVFMNIKERVGDVVPSEDPFLVMGVDWGQVDDFTVLTVIDRKNNNVLKIERFRELDWKTQRSRIKELYERWRIDVIVAEANNAAPNIEALAEEGVNIIGFTTTSKSKSYIIRKLAVGIQNGEIVYPDYQPLLAELSAFGVTKGSTGVYKYGAPSGMHDDCVMSLAIAYSAEIEGIYMPGSFEVFSV